MKKLKSWLTGLLLIQLLLAVALVWNNQWQARKNLPEPLLAIDWQQVDKLTLEDKNNRITLIKPDSTWLLEQQKLPVKKDEVTLFINNLKRLQTSWPVATSSNSHKRFDVSPEKFLRHIEIYQGDNLIGELFLGNSTKLRRSHARRSGDDDVYDVEIDTVDILVNSEKWFDDALLATGDPESIKGPDYTIKRTGALWEFNQAGPSIFLGSAAHGNVDQERAETLANAFTRLTVSGWRGDKPDLNGANVKKTKMEIFDGNNRWTYQFIEMNGKHYVTRDDQDHLFKIDMELFEQLTSIRQAYLKKKIEALPENLLKETEERPAQESASQKSPAQQE